MDDVKTYNIPENRKVSPFDFIVSPRAEMEANLYRQLESMNIISEPNNPVLPKAEEKRLRAVTDKWQERDLKSFDSMIRTMIQLAQDPTTILDDDAIYVFNPMQKEVLHFLRHDFLEGNLSKSEFMTKFENRQAPQTETVFGLTLLLETGKSSFHYGNKPNPTNLRHHAIRLAKEVKDHMKRLYDGELQAGIYRNMKPETITDLGNKITELDIYIESPGGDLYHQMPWTAGIQISEFLYAGMEFGMTVCRSHDLFGQTLHTYNLLRQIAPKTTSAIPILEELCGHFKDQIFLGGRPRRRFMPTLMQFMGGKIAMDKDKERNPKGQFHIGAPQTLNDGTADNNRIKPRELSIFTICDLPNHLSVTATKKQTLAIEQEMREAPFALTLERVRVAVPCEFEGSFPIAKINWFKIYDLSVAILTDIAKRYQRKMPADMMLYQSNVQSAPADACAGSSFVIMLISHADTMKEVSRNWQGDKSPTVEMTFDAFKSVLGDDNIKDLNCSQFQWKNADE